MKWVFGADTQPFRKGLDQMRTETKAFANSIKGQLIGALGISAIITGFKNLFVEMDRIQKLGQRFGESAETIQKIGLAADLAGAPLETLAKAITVATKNANEAATGNVAYAESFARLGIDAKSFVNLPMEQKMIALAGAFEKGKGSGETLANMMEVLGKSGAELIPTLSQGQEELQKQFDNTSTASQSTVDAIAKFNDQITKAKQTAQVAGAAIVDIFRISFGALGAYLGMFAGNAIITLETLIAGAMDAGKVIAKALSGNLSGAADAAKSFAGRFEAAFEDAKNNAKATAEVIGELYDEIYNSPGKTAGAGPDVEDIAEEAEQSLRIEQERRKLTEEIAKLEEDAKMRSLSITERILELEKERNGLIAEMETSDDATKALEARKKILELDKEIAKERATKDAEDASAAKKISDATAETSKRIADAATREAEAQRNREFNGADDAGKLDILRKEQADLIRQSKEAGKAGDYEGQITLRTEAAAKGDEIEDLLDTLKSESISPAIATSSLASIGAGGSANLLNKDTIEQRKVSLLEMIANNTSKTETGNSKIPEPV